MDTSQTIQIPSHKRKLWNCLGGILILPLLLSPVVAIDPLLEKDGRGETTLVFAIGSAIIGVPLLVWQLWFAIYSLELGNSLVVHYFFRMQEFDWAEVESVSVERRAGSVDNIPISVHKLGITIRGGRSLGIDISPELIDTVTALAHRCSQNSFSSEQTPVEKLLSTEACRRRLEQQPGPTSTFEGLATAFLSLVALLFLHGFAVLIGSYLAGELEEAKPKAIVLVEDPVRQAVSQTISRLGSADPVAALELLVEESPGNREYLYHLALKYLKAMEGKVVYEKGTIRYERNANPQSQDDFRRKAKLALETLLVDEPRNPKYLDAYSKACNEKPEFIRQ